jgi:hypothetical protein
VSMDVAQVLAELIVEEIMTVDGVRCTRIALKSGQLGRERDHGGYSRTALIDLVRESLRKNLILVVPAEPLRRVASAQPRS